MNKEGTQQYISKIKNLISIGKRECQLWYRDLINNCQFRHFVAHVIPVAYARSPR